MNAEHLHVVMLTRAIAPLHGVGGLERHTYDLVHHLLERGVRVTLVTQPATSEVPAGDKVFSHSRLSIRYVPYVSLPLGGRRGTTVIDRSTAYPLFGWRVGRLALELVNRGDVHLVHGMGAASLGFAHARLKDWYSTVPFVFNPHGLEEFGSTGPALDSVKHLAYAPLRHAVRVCARAADRVIATDRALVATVIGHLGVPSSRVSVVPNAVDLARIDALAQPVLARQLRERLGLTQADTLLVSVGRLEQNKGFTDLIAALVRLSEQPQTQRQSARWRSVILGDGPYRAELVRAIRASGLGDRILLLGRTSEAELHGWYEAATLFVHPTRYEGSSIVTLEAMAHRRAVLATSAGGLPDKVRPGVNGWLVSPRDVSGLAQTLMAATTTQSKVIDEMGLKSREIVEQEFSWDAVVDRLLGLYDAILSGRAIVQHPPVQKGSE